MQILMTVALMLANILIALQTTILNTVAIEIVQELGGKELLPWVFAIYILASTTFIPLFGKWATKYGCKKVFLIALGIFAIANIGSGLSGTIEMLILFRLVMGIAAAGILPITNIIIGDAFTMEQRTKLQGRISLIWGVGALLGPFLGALVVTLLDWRWIFYLTVPIVVLIIYFIWVSYAENLAKVDTKIDYKSVTYFSLGSISILTFTMDLKEYWLFLLAAIFVIAFVRNEIKSSNPFLPVLILKDKTIVFFSLNSFLIFFALFGMENYIPTYLQTYQGVTIIGSGLILAGISVGWMVSSYLLAPIMKVMKYTTIVILGNVIAFISVVFMAFYHQDTHWSVMLTILLMQGISYGFVQTCSMLAVYEIVDEEHKTMASSLQSFSRNIGTAFSIGYLGNLLVNDLEHMMQYASLVAMILIVMGSILYKILIIPKK